MIQNGSMEELPIPDIYLALRLLVRISYQCFYDNDSSMPLLCAPSSLFEYIPKISFGSLASFPVA